MFFNQKILKTAYQQIRAAALLTDDEKQAAREITAIDKAYTELVENKTFEFDGTVLSFTSRYSNQPRKVTASGCVKDYCPCLNAISYHSAAFSIVERYAQIEAAENKRRSAPFQLETVKVRVCQNMLTGKFGVVEKARVGDMCIAL